jgi:hypothetical protein
VAHHSAGTVGQGTPQGVSSSPGASFPPAMTVSDRSALGTRSAADLVTVGTAVAPSLTSQKVRHCERDDPCGTSAALAPVATLPVPVDGSCRHDDSPTSPLAGTVAVWGAITNHRPHGGWSRTANAPIRNWQHGSTSLLRCFCHEDGVKQREGISSTGSSILCTEVLKGRWTRGEACRTADLPEDCG